MPIANGILTGGLGGNASSMILGQFNMGFITITVEPDPDPDTQPTITGSPSGGGGDGLETVRKHKITFTIRHKKHSWQKEYIVDESTGNIVITILNVWSKIKNRINITVQGIKKKLGNIRIKIK